MNLLAYITAKDAERDLHWCPCCRDRYDADDMDLSGGWEHSAAMKDRFGAACCNGCTDDHLVTLDGVLMRRAACVMGYEGWYSSAEALAEARAA
jgi:hypothetical protein